MAPRRTSECLLFVTVRQTTWAQAFQFNNSTTRSVGGYRECLTELKQYIQEIGQASFSHQNVLFLRKTRIIEESGIYIWQLLKAIVLKKDDENVTFPLDIEVY